MERSLGSLKQIEYCGQVDGRGEIMMGEMRKGEMVRLISQCWSIPPPPQIASFLVSCVLERMFTDQAMQYAIITAYVGSTQRFLLRPRYGPALKGHATNPR